MSSREEVVASAMYAMAEWVKQAGDDPLGAWAPVLDKLPGIPGDHTRRRVCKQLVENRGAGKRFERARKWSTRQNAEREFVMGQLVDDGEKIGFIDFTDEAAADYLSCYFDDDSINLDMIRNIRTKYSIKKLPRSELTVHQILWQRS